MQETEFPIASGTITYGFAAFFVHEADNLTSFLQKFKRILHEKGKAVFIEWEKKETEMGSPVHHRIDKYELAKTLIKQGLINIQQVNLSDQFYVLIAPKSPDR